MTDTTEMPDEPKAKRGVNIAPSSMVEESIADWPLHLVIEYLRKKEKEGAADVELDCRLFGTSSIRLFTSIVDELAEHYNVSRGKMSRWLSYHGTFIAREDSTLTALFSIHSRIRKLALEGDCSAIADILGSGTPYSPCGEEGKRVSLYVYSSWVLSYFNQSATVCGVSPSQVAQIYMLRSMLSSDLPVLTSVADRIARESKWWDRWMRFRTSVMEMAVSAWGSG